MRITYRKADNKEYWTKRWGDIPADLPMENANVYPLRYAQKTVQSKDGLILEAGCGAGRILRYYHDRGYNIIGIDFIEDAITKLKKIDPTLKVEVGDITDLQFKDGTFRYILAFGLYHNLEHGLKKAIDETFRVLKKDGLVCASFRADNIQNRLNDWLEARRSGHRKDDAKDKIFHKMNLTKSEFKKLFEKHHFKIKSIYTVVNMPFLYKFAFFRARDHKFFDENRARKEGYKLSFLGRLITSFLLKFFPDQFCNIYVLIAEKPKS